MKTKIGAFFLVLAFIIYSLVLSTIAQNLCPFFIDDTSCDCSSDDTMLSIEYSIECKKPNDEPNFNNFIIDIEPIDSNKTHLIQSLTIENKVILFINIV